MPPEDYTRTRTPSSSLEGEQGQIGKWKSQSEVSRWEIWGGAGGGGTSPLIVLPLSPSLTPSLPPLLLHPLIKQCFFPIGTAPYASKAPLHCPPCVQGGVENLHWILLKDKLMHIKIFLPVYLNRNLLESAAPNRKWLGALSGQEPAGKDLCREAVEAKKEAVRLAAA